MRRETRYIGRLRCDKGNYEYLWNNYANYNDETELYDTVEGESLTKQELRALCLEDGVFDVEFDNMRNNLAHSAVHNLLA